MLKAVSAVREEGASVPCVITVVDRLEGASDNLKKENVDLKAVLTVRDFVL